jgi:tyrosinase
MTTIRKDVWHLGAGWSDPLIWYAKAVHEMRSRPFADPTSWLFLAAMHGFDPDAWTAFGYITKTTPLPAAAVQKTYWSKCQHQSWFFLPWHRGYLWSFETIVRAAIVKLGGPHDWTLPYWNYNNAAIAHANQLPPAFAAATMPDGSHNPLFVKQRYGANRTPIVVPKQMIRPVAQNDDRFTGGEGGAHPGFGGPQTIFHHGGEDDAPNGGLESEPHNNVHSAVGGNLPNADTNDPKNLGLMSDPDQAALDPIFWLHHANIDRLWEVWRNNNPGRHKDPTLSAWLNGPATEVFAVPDAAGKKVEYRPKDMLDTKAPNLGYTYEDVSTPKPTAFVATRLSNLGASADVVANAIERPPVQQPAEVVGANDAKVDLSQGVATTSVKLDKPATAKVTQSLAAAVAPAAQQAPDRVFLRLENIRGFNDAALFSVYVGLPPGADPEAHPENLAGNISLFGGTKASRNSGNGLTQVFDISSIVDSLHLSGVLQGADALDVRFVPYRPEQTNPEMSIGAVKIVREPQ